MIDKRAFKFACCTKCGALADVETDIVGFNQRDVELCKHPPIENCPDMKTAIREAKPKAADSQGRFGASADALRVTGAARRVAASATQSAG